MHILITGGSGFLGARLARTLLAQEQFALRGAAPRRVERLTLTDRVPLPLDLSRDARVHHVAGDLLSLLEGGEAFSLRGVDAVFHLAAAVSAECETDFDLGLRSNLHATQALLQACRATGAQPVFVFASSLAVFGSLPGQCVPDPVEDLTLPTPQGSYGVQKFMCEQLVADCSRKGFVAGRSARLMTVSVRPGRPNGAASGFFSGMVREPLAGLRAQVPVHPETPVAVSSPARTIEGLMHAAAASDASWGPAIALNLPSLHTTVGGMAEALERVAGREATALLDWVIDPKVEALVRTWPGRFEWRRAREMGLRADDDFDTAIRAYIRENPQAVRLPVR
ncbi:D-erythronate dehydrogenase [Ramlibacter sp. AN1015]|uniref:D-erythronate dehydrogenase n=1 Tax=Ramlibacter sp. AN1015 TaxID=3133428 RepID=UPI0030C57E0A